MKTLKTAFIIILFTISQNVFANTITTWRDESLYKTLKKSCELANIAAGLSIQQLGTVSVSKSDINNAIKKS